MTLLTALGVGASLLLGVGGFITAWTGRQSRHDSRAVSDVTLQLTALRDTVNAQETRIDGLEEANARFVTALVACRGNNRILIHALERHQVPVPELKFDDTY